MTKNPWSIDIEVTSRLMPELHDICGDASESAYRPENLMLNLQIPDLWIGAERQAAKILERLNRRTSPNIKIQFSSLGIDFPHFRIFIERDKTGEYREKWTWEDPIQLHRLTGPAVIIDGTVRTEQWHMHGRQVKSFRYVLESGSWEEYIEGKPEHIPVVLELHRHGLLNIAPAVFENLQTMAEV